MGHSHTRPSPRCYPCFMYRSRQGGRGRSTVKKHYASESRRRKHVAAALRSGQLRLVQLDAHRRSEIAATRPSRWPRRQASTVLARRRRADVRGARGATPFLKLATRDVSINAQDRRPTSSPGPSETSSTSTSSSSKQEAISRSSGIIAKRRSRQDRSTTSYSGVRQTRSP